jgi:PGF-CTERM protein
MVIYRQSTTTLVATLVVVWSVAAVAAFGGTVAADQHTKDEAPDVSDKANFTIAAVSPSDHYPGDKNPENASLRYWSAGEQAFVDQGAEEGIWFNQIYVTADWIDYTACDTDNTAAFGIDRGNNNSGTEIDEDLVQYQRRSVFKDDGIDIFFYNWDDFAGNPPYMAPEDAIVAEQGENSNAGACMTMTEEPGWYQIQAFFNGTIANEDCTDSDNDDCEPENKERIGGHLSTNYFYVCECDSEAEAREQLGAPPDEEGDSTPTPTETTDGEETETPTPTETPDDETTDGEETETPTPTETTAPTETPEDGTVDDTTDGDADVEGDDQQADDELTPTPGDGPGFTGLAALLALLAAALLAYRRD